MARNKQIDKKVRRVVDKRDEAGSEKSSKEQIFICRISLYDHHYVYCEYNLVLLIVTANWCLQLAVIPYFMFYCTVHCDTIT